MVMLVRLKVLISCGCYKYFGYNLSYLKEFQLINECHCHCLNGKHMHSSSLLGLSFPVVAQEEFPWVGEVSSLLSSNKHC